ncbi:MAG: BamA/TamA family outer membrane protein [Elusimicrobiota bacterium]
MFPRTLLAILLAAVCAAGHAQNLENIPSRAFPEEARQAPQEDETPWIVRWMIRPLKRGMFIRLPIIDTDPNRGITAGVMPIWVIQGKTDDRIEQIHAPSLTYNRNFKLIPTYRFYYYPQEDASLTLRGSWSQYEREIMGQYEDGSILGTEFDIFARLQYNMDAGQRFYGFGPDTPKNGESNYKEEYFQYKLGLGMPFFHKSAWRLRVTEHLQSDRILDGPLPNLPLFAAAYPVQLARGRQQTNEHRLTLVYDTRDHAVTTARGRFLEVYGERAVHGLASAYDYGRYGFDARWFKPWPSGNDKVLAVQARYEQLLGPTPPFWIMPKLGGKSNLRAYGEGRYSDRGVAALNVEQRFKVFESRMAGVTTEFQLAPFIGAGTVFDNPGRAAAKYIRPVVGGAARAVAKPQVVGSIDCGVGREGVAVFMDINYSF